MGVVSKPMQDITPPLLCVKLQGSRDLYVLMGAVSFYKFVIQTPSILPQTPYNSPLYDPLTCFKEFRP